MHFLVVDFRFGTPIYVFLESDPHGQDGCPDRNVREVTLAPRLGPSPVGWRASIGRDPAHLEQFREFASDGAVDRAGFILVEPRYVGPSWEGYCCQFRPQGEKPTKRRCLPPLARGAD